MKKRWLGLLLVLCVLAVSSVWSAAVEFQNRSMQFSGMGGANYDVPMDPRDPWTGTHKTPDAYYIFTKPSQFRAWPGQYVVGFFMDDETIALMQTFDFDPVTKKFTWYESFHSESAPAAGECDAVQRIRIIDRNTVEAEDVRWKISRTIKYVPYKGLPEDTYAGVDANGYTWYAQKSKQGDSGSFFPEITHKVDAGLAFLAANGQTGPVPEGYNVNWFRIVETDEWVES